MYRLRGFRSLNFSWDNGRLDSSILWVRSGDFFANYLNVGESTRRFVTLGDSTTCFSGCSFCSIFNGSGFCDYRVIGLNVCVSFFCDRGNRALATFRVRWNNIGSYRIFSFFFKGAFAGNIFYTNTGCYACINYLISTTL